LPHVLSLADYYSLGRSCSENLGDMRETSPIVLSDMIGAFLLSHRLSCHLAPKGGFVVAGRCDRSRVSLCPKLRCMCIWTPYRCHIIGQYGRNLTPSFLEFNLKVVQRSTLSRMGRKGWGYRAGWNDYEVVNSFLSLSLLSPYLEFFLVHVFPLTFLVLDPASIALPSSCDLARERPRDSRRGLSLLLNERTSIQRHARLLTCTGWFRK